MHDGYHGYYCYNVSMFITRDAARVFVYFVQKYVVYISKVPRRSSWTFDHAFPRNRVIETSLLTLRKQTFQCKI